MEYKFVQFNRSTQNFAKIFIMFCGRFSSVLKVVWKDKVSKLDFLITIDYLL